MTTEISRRGKFTQAVSHHIFGHVNRNKLSPIVNRECMPHKIRGNHRCTTPGFHYLFLIRLIQLVHLTLKLMVNKRSFLEGSRHGYLRLASRRRTMYLSEADLRLRVLYPLAGTPEGERGCPPLAFPSPPPIG